MILSHKYRFIFIKTRKTAGTSIECLLSQWCAPEDIVTPILPPVEGHEPRNWRGWYNPWADLTQPHPSYRQILARLVRRTKYWNHMPACLVRARVPKRIWDGYFKFCFERNPWDKALSHYHMIRQRSSRELSFDDYLVRDYLPLHQPLYTEPKSPRTLLVDHVARYENLNDELQHISRQLGLPFSGELDVFAKREFRKDRRPYQDVYTPSQRQRVEEIFRHEIEIMGYTFD